MATASQKTSSIHVPRRLSSTVRSSVGARFGFHRCLLCAFVENFLYVVWEDLGAEPFGVTVDLGDSVPDLMGEERME